MADDSVGKRVGVKIKGFPLRLLHAAFHHIRAYIHSFIHTYSYILEYREEAYEHIELYKVHTLYLQPQLTMGLLRNRFPGPRTGHINQKTNLLPNVKRQ